MTAQAAIDVAFQPQPGAVYKIRGTGPDGIFFEETTATFKLVKKNGFFYDAIDPSKEWAVIVMDKPAKAMTAFVGGKEKPLPNNIKFYKPFEIQWELWHPQDMKWYKAGKSDNRVYVTLKEPKTDKLYESLADIGVRNADGKNARIAAIDAIQKDFADPLTPVKRKAMDGLNKKDGAGMQYWVDASSPKDLLDAIRARCFALPFMLDPDPKQAFVFINQKPYFYKNIGTCEAWSALFKGALGAVGLDGTPGVDGATIAKIEPNNAITNGNPVGNWVHDMVCSWAGGCVRL